MTVILRQAQDEVDGRETRTLTLSPSKGEGGRRRYLNNRMDG